MAHKEQLPRKTFSEITEPLDHSRPIIVMDHEPRELSEAADSGVDLVSPVTRTTGQMFPANIVVSFLWENACGVLKKRFHDIRCHIRRRSWGPAMRSGPIMRS